MARTTRGGDFVNSSSSSRRCLNGSSSGSKSTDGAGVRLLASATDTTAAYVLALGRHLHRGLMHAQEQPGRSTETDGAAHAQAQWPPMKTASLGECYRLGKQIGRGHFGVVRQCEDVATRGVFACKTIFKSSIAKEEDVTELCSEVLSMLRLQSVAAAGAAADDARPLAGAAASAPGEGRGEPLQGSVAWRCESLLRLHEVFDDAEAVHLILDHCAGGDLFDHVSRSKRLGEREAARVLEQLARAVSAMHAAGVVHRDLKPENVLLVSPASSAARATEKISVKLADFGLAVALAPGQRVRGIAGSPFYMAPEVVSGRAYGAQVDVWSLGVILYTCLAGCLPFWGRGHDAVFTAVRKAQPDLSKKPWPQVSAEAKDLVFQMLTADPAKRISVVDILQHPWMLQHCPKLRATTATAPTAGRVSLAGTCFTEAHQQRQQQQQQPSDSLTATSLNGSSTNGSSSGSSSSSNDMLLEQSSYESSGMSSSSSSISTSTSTSTADACASGQQTIKKPLKQPELEQHQHRQQQQQEQEEQQQQQPAQGLNAPNSPNKSRTPSPKAKDLPRVPSLRRPSRPPPSFSTSPSARPATPNWLRPVAINLANRFAGTEQSNMAATTISRRSDSSSGGSTASTSAHAREGLHKARPASPVLRPAADLPLPLSLMKGVTATAAASVACSSALSSLALKEAAEYCCGDPMGDADRLLDGATGHCFRLGDELLCNAPAPCGGAPGVDMDAQPLMFDTLLSQLLSPVVSAAVAARAAGPSARVASGTWRFPFGKRSKA